GRAVGWVVEWGGDPLRGATYAEGCEACGGAPRAINRVWGAPGAPHVGQILEPDFAQSSRNFLSPMSVSGCFMSCSSTAKGMVATWAPALAASTTCSGLRIEAASTCVLKP